MPQIRMSLVLMPHVLLPTLENNTSICFCRMHTHDAYPTRPLPRFSTPEPTWKSNTSISSRGAAPQVPMLPQTQRAPHPTPFGTVTHLEEQHQHLLSSCTLPGRLRRRQLRQRHQPLQHLECLLRFRRCCARQHGVDAAQRGLGHAVAPGGGHGCGRHVSAAAAAGCPSACDWGCCF